MHPDIAYQLFSQRHAELFAEAAQHRQVRETRQARPSGRVRQVDRRWWQVYCPTRPEPSEQRSLGADANAECHRAISVGFVTNGTFRDVRCDSLFMQADATKADPELLAAVAGGDLGALRLLYDRHAPWLSARLTGEQQRRCGRRRLAGHVHGPMEGR